MKKFFNYLVVVVCAFALSLSLVGCGEKSFNDVPWSACEKTSAEILSNLDDSKTNMETARLQTKYKATTVFEFFDAGSFSKMQVREETTFILQFGTRESCSKIETSRYIDNVLTQEVTDIYVANGAISTVYRTVRSYADGELASENKTKTSASISPQNIYTKYIFVQSDTLSGIVSKKFEDVDYYRLTANSNECNVLMTKFSQVGNLQQNPQMFALSNKQTDLLMGYNVEYGISDRNYITYFALSYRLENNEKSSQNSFETFLKFSTSVTLEQYGLEVELPEQPLDRDYN
ncbi:MAG: hypothetical protein ACI4L7_04310 [Christensenellales bacterium]